MSEELAQAFHSAYERLAPSFGYETRKASAVPWEQIPEQNRKLMIAVAGEIQRQFDGRCAPLVEAAKFLLQLKYGPRDDAYYRAKDGAWQALNDAVRDYNNA